MVEWSSKYRAPPPIWKGKETKGNEAKSKLLSLEKRCLKYNPLIYIKMFVFGLTYIRKRQNNASLNKIKWIMYFSKLIPKIMFGKLGGAW